MAFRWLTVFNKRFIDMIFFQMNIFIVLVTHGALRGLIFFKSYGMKSETTSVNNVTCSLRRVTLGLESPYQLGRVALLGGQAFVTQAV